MAKEKTVKVAKSATLDRDRIGKTIRNLREGKKLDAKTLAALAGIDASNLCRIEQGKYSVGLDILTQLANQLGYRVDFVPINAEDTVPKAKVKKESIKRPKDRYERTNFDRIVIDPYYDTLKNPARIDYLKNLGLDLTRCSVDDVVRIIPMLSEARVIYYGNGKCILNYGNIMGLAVIYSLEFSLGKKARDIVIGASCSACHFISDAYADYVNKLMVNGYDKEAEDEIAMTSKDFMDKAIKRIYDQGLSSRELDLVQTAAKQAVRWRFEKKTYRELFEIILRNVENVAYNEEIESKCNTFENSEFEGFTMS